MSKFTVVVLAAGRSTRFGAPDERKPFATLGGRAVWQHSVERFVGRPDVCQTILVVGPEDRPDFARKFGASLLFLGVEVCEGGAERADSVRAALARVSPEATHLAVHDAARPLVTAAEIDAVFAAAIETGAAILATPVTATLKRVDAGTIVETAPRDGLWGAQTPQAFELGLYRRATESAGAVPVTDDAQLVERLGARVAVVEGSPRNLKITTRADLRLAEAIVAANLPPAKQAPPTRSDDDPDDLFSR